MNNDLLEALPNRPNVPLSDNDIESTLLRLIDVITLAYELEDVETQRQVSKLMIDYCLSHLSKNSNSSADNLCLFLLKILHSKPSVIAEFLAVIKDE